MMTRIVATAVELANLESIKMIENGVKKKGK